MEPPGANRTCLVGADEAITTGDFFGERRDEALAVDGDMKGGTEAGQQFGDMERSMGFPEYVICHIHL